MCDLGEALGQAAQEPTSQMLPMTTFRSPRTGSTMSQALLMKYKIKDHLATIHFFVEKLDREKCVENDATTNHDENHK